MVDQSKRYRRQKCFSGRIFRVLITSEFLIAALRFLPAVILNNRMATSWMGMYCLNMLSIALELARQDPAYEDVASKFFEHFVYICNAMNNIASEGIELWNNEDGFFYDVLTFSRWASFSDENSFHGWINSVVCSSLHLIQKRSIT